MGSSLLRWFGAAGNDMGRMQVNDLSLGQPWGANKMFDVYKRLRMVDRHACEILFTCCVKFRNYFRQRVLHSDRDIFG